MTTPAQDAPLVFPSVAFRPLRLLVFSVVLTAAAVAAAAAEGRVMLGVFFGLGLLLGLINAVMVQRSVDTITAKENPQKSSMAINSAARLAIITVVALAVAFVFKPNGVGALFGLALFQIVLVASTALPVWKKLRSGEAHLAPGPDLTGSDVTEGRSAGND